MFDLPSSSVKSWTNHGRSWVPSAISTFCPFCSERVLFSLHSFNPAPSQEALTAAASCPGCHNNCYFWILQPGASNDTSQRGCRALAMFPRPLRKREPISGVELVPERIRNSYEDVIKVYNSGVWTATATCCRRTLEGVVGHLLPKEEQKSSLFQNLEKLKDNVDLAAPIHSLSSGLRAGGNLGAHFDGDREPDQLTAEAMVDLIDYLLEYVFTLPKLSENLQQRIDGLAAKRKTGA